MSRGPASVVCVLSILSTVLVMAGNNAVAVGPAPEAAISTEWNDSPDPYALYGFCLAGSIGSGSGSKTHPIAGVGESLADVLAIAVLQCVPFSGGGGNIKVTCPAGSPYAYCVRNRNDGLGNDITLGVLKVDAVTHPYGLYTGCPAGANLKRKISLVTAAGKDPRMIKGLVTLACNAATDPAPVQPEVTPCPTSSTLYSFCLGTPNDGSGNAVTIGVVGAVGAADPYGLYGECNTTPAPYGIQPGFLYKSYLVRAVGRSLDNVRSIDLLFCNAPVGFGGGFPDHVETREACDPYVVPSLAGQYDYCIVGTDDKGNGVVAGVNQQ